MGIIDMKQMKEDNICQNLSIYDSQWWSSIRPYQQYQSMTPYQHLYMSKPCDYYLAWSYIQQSLTSKAADLAPQEGISMKHTKHKL